MRSHSLNRLDVDADFFLLHFSNRVFSIVPNWSLVVSEFWRVLASTLRLVFSKSRPPLDRSLPSHRHEFLLWNREVFLLIMIQKGVSIYIFLVDKHL